MTITDDARVSSGQTTAVDLDSDRLLVERFQVGDVVAFDELFRRHYTRLCTFCRRRLGSSSAEAEDVAQEAFLRAYRALGTLDGERRFYPWLTVIAARLCIDVARRQSRIAAVETAAIGATADVEVGAASSLCAIDLRSAASRVPASELAVLELSMQAKSYAEIGNLLGIPVHQVRDRLLRARRRLRYELRERWIAAPPMMWLSRRVERLRLWAGDGLALACSGAVPLTAAFLGVLPSEDGTMARRGTIAVDVGRAPAVATPSPVDRPSVTDAPIPAAPSPSREPTSPDAPADAVLDQLPGSSTPSSEEMAGQCEDMAIHADTGPLTVCVEPTAPRQWIVDELPE